MPIDFSTRSHNPTPTATAAQASVVIPRNPSAKPLRVAALAFNKHIADELNSRMRSSSDLIPGSPEQEAIWEFFLHGAQHGVVRACAGVGKTFCLIQGVLRMMRETPVDFTAMTYNSFGWRACKRAYGCELDSEKVNRLVDALCEDRYGRDNLGWQKWMEVTGAVRRLVSLCMNYLDDGTSRTRLEEFSDSHNVVVNGSADLVFESVPIVLRQCADETSIMSFDDQVWQTVTKKLPCDTYDVLLVDEAQDTNRAQQEMVFQACPKGRVIVCGDPRQAIYGFRGADVTAMPRMEEALSGTDRGVRIFPLTVTRRCPARHVVLAQAIVPEIRCLDDAPYGEVAVMSTESSVRAMRPGDLVLCRTNAPLVAVCYALIRAGMKAIIRGRDIGSNLSQLITKLKDVRLPKDQTDADGRPVPEPTGEIPILLAKLEVYREKELGKLARLKARGAAKVEALTDRCECIEALCDGVNSVSALKAKIDRIFADFDDTGKPKDAVVLGSVHRTKGLEAYIVYVIAPELLPHPMARQPWERVQERNLAYVAVTRAKFDPVNPVARPGRIVFVSNERSVKLGIRVPPIYSGDDEPPMLALIRQAQEISERGH